MSADSHSHDQNMSPRKLFYLALGSVGVVYGDIGTSPLYAFREALKPVAADGLTRFEVISVVSLMIWALTIIVTIKYVLLLLRAPGFYLDMFIATLIVLAAIFNHLIERRGLA